MAIATTNTLSSMIQTAMQKALQAKRADSLFFPGGPLFNVLRVADLTARPGIAAPFNVYGSLTAYDTVEGEDVASVDSLTANAVTVTATEKQVPTYISNLSLSALADPNALQERMMDEAVAHVQAHAAKFDAAVMALASSLTSGFSSTGKSLTVAGVIGAVKILQENNAPRPYIGVISTQQWYDLTTEASSSLADASKSGSVGEGVWGEWRVPTFLGVNWFVTPAIAGAIDATDDWGMILSNRAIGCVVKAIPGQGDIEVVDLPKSRSKMISSVSTYGVGVIEATSGVYLKTGTS